MATLSSNAEIQAEKAQSLPAFSSLRLSHIKDQLEKLLALIGRDGIFDEYTQHDISHIDKMLGILDWLVPEETKKIMSPTDWLMTVLAIYFHDLGMLVTKREYDARELSGFSEFRDTVLYAGDKGHDYRIKVEKLGDERGERFAYQEFVRSKHAERIRSWIIGQDREHLGITTEVVSELDTLLMHFSIQFRRDLALVCESHHLNDLDDFTKYKTSQPYGDSEEETANIQYAAILMRTADLLHITGDRTPSISFRIINPTDPISQDEWAKQQAVTRIRSKIGRDEEGIPDENAPRNTIEVHAYFRKEEGFFGLTSYLLYVADQLQKSYEWVSEANKSLGIKHKFPWRHIDDTYIETEGFIKETFEFTFDQAKILDLLTGHTLYNDVKIVLRELVQNSIDAVRLQSLVDRANSETSVGGRVSISWDSMNRILTVEDNGTGMTQQIVEHNLLRVGSSRYQGEEFKIDYPDFSPISRFGIGVLSTFMISDSVEILTCHPQEEYARQLSLRSVHGKYLVRLLDKHTEAKKLAPHGTQIKLKVRSSIDMSDIEETARRWIAIPKCEVRLKIDENEPITIGFPSPKDAVKDYLFKRVGYTVEDFEKNRIKIIEEKEDNVTLAYAVEWSEYFKEWSFVRTRQLRARTNSQNSPDEGLGTCVEGIRVEFNTPGYYAYTIVAIANAEGINAPKTNVARSGLESTPERDNMLNIIYKLFCRHITNEVKELYQKRSFSLTWAVNESRILLDYLVDNNRHSALNSPLLFENLTDLPLLIVETNGERKPTSIRELRGESFWTIDCASFESAEDLLREIPGNSSIFSLMNAFKSGGLKVPMESIACNIDPRDTFDNLVFTTKEVAVIKIDHAQRRVDLMWKEKSDPLRWRRFPNNIHDRVRIRPRDGYDDFSRFDYGFDALCVGNADIQVEGVTNEVAVKAFGSTFLLPNTPVAKLLLSWIDKLENLPTSTEAIDSAFFVFSLVRAVLRGSLATPIDDSDIYEMWGESGIPKEIGLNELKSLLNKTVWKVFDPSIWRRSAVEEDATEW